MSFSYRAFSLNIASDMELPELCAGTGDPVDVHVRVCPRQDHNHVSLKSDDISFDVKDVARFTITKGREIEVARDDGAEDALIRVFLLGSAMGAILHQRDFLVLHGNAVEVEGGCIVFVGPSGNGKSTLAGAFYKKGFRILTDDVCAVTFQHGIPFVVPGYPQIKLWHDAAQKLDEDPSTLRQLSHKLNKYALPVRSSFPEQPLRLKGVYVLNTSMSAGFDIAILRGVDKFHALYANTYRLQFLQESGQRLSHFNHCNTLAKHIEVKQVIRPRAPFLLQELTELLLRHLSNIRKEEASWV